MQLTCTLISWDRADVRIGTAREPRADVEHTIVIDVAELSRRVLLTLYGAPSRADVIAALRAQLAGEQPPAIEKTFVIEV